MHSFYAHLWSIADAGAGFVDQLERAGCNALSYAFTYHSVRQLLPSDPVRHIHYATRSHAYFVPRAHYGWLRPTPSPLVGDGAVPLALHRDLRARGMRLKAWVIGCHNSDLAVAHPDCAVRNALGEALPHHLCPAHPEVRRYLETLVADIAAQYAPYALELESFDYPDGFRHGAHHEMSGLPLDPLHSELLALCFCPSCRAAAEARGCDAPRLAAAVADELRLWLRTPAWRLAEMGDGNHRRAAFAAEQPEWAPYAQARAAVVDSLGVGLREAVRAVAPATRLLPIGLPRWRPDREAAGGSSGGAGAAEPPRAGRLTSDGGSRGGVATWVDGVVTASTADAVADARRALPSATDIVCGVYPMMPRPLSPAALVDTLRTCAAAGCTGFNYYNHALMQSATHRDIRAAIDALGAGA